MFHPGDIVSYGTNGVCEITEQKRVRLAGQPCDCLILKPIYDHSMTICVPCSSQVLLDRMRPLPTKEELLAMLREPAPAHEPDADARKEQYRKALQSGDRHDLLRMVRDIRPAPGPQGPRQGTFGLRRPRPARSPEPAAQRVCVHSGHRAQRRAPVHCGRTGRRIKNDDFLTNIFCHAIFNTRAGRPALQCFETKGVC